MKPMLMEFAAAERGDRSPKHCTSNGTRVVLFACLCVTIGEGRGSDWPAEELQSASY